MNKKKNYNKLFNSLSDLTTEEYNQFRKELKHIVEKIIYNKISYFNHNQKKKYFAYEIDVQEITEKSFLKLYENIELYDSTKSSPITFTYLILQNFIKKEITNNKNKLYESYDVNYNSKQEDLNEKKLSQIKIKNILYWIILKNSNLNDKEIKSLLKDIEEDWYKKLKIIKNIRKNIMKNKIYKKFSIYTE